MEFSLSEETKMLKSNAAKFMKEKSPVLPSKIS